MIQFLVSLYRGAIAIIFILALLVFGSMASSGGTELGVIAFAGLIAVVLALGMSATLISINDHLAAMRAGRAPTQVTPVAAPVFERGPAPELRPWTAAQTRNVAIVLVAVIAIVATIAIFERSGDAEQPANQTAAVEAPAVPAVEGGGPARGNDPLCDPAKAAAVGLSCD